MVEGRSRAAFESDIVRHSETISSDPQLRTALNVQDIDVNLPAISASSACTEGYARAGNTAGSFNRCSVETVKHPGCACIQDAALTCQCIDDETAVPHWLQRL